MNRSRAEKALTATKLFAVVALAAFALERWDTSQQRLFDRQNSQMKLKSCALARTLMISRSSFPAEKALYMQKLWIDWTLSLIKMRTKSGTWRKFSVKGQYVKIGNRLEITKSNNVRFDSNQITREEFKEIFGPCLIQSVQPLAFKILCEFEVTT